MMKQSIAFCLLLPLVANADNRYWGVDYSMIDIEFDNATFNTTALQGVVGTYVHERAGTPFPLAIEGRVGLGISDDSVSDGGTTLTFDSDRYFGVYLRGEYPISPQLTLYGLLGYTKIKLKVSLSDGFDSASGSQSDSDFSFGFGGRYQFNDSITVNAEFLPRFADEEESEIDALSIGLRYRW